MVNFKDYYYDNQLEVQEESLGNKLKAMAAAGMIAMTPASGQIEFNLNKPSQKTHNQTKQITPSVTYRSMLKQLAEHEGFRHTVYNDPEGLPTIGIGFNLADPTNQKILIQTLGLTPSPSLKLTNEQIEKLYKITFNRALSDAKKFYPDFDTLPVNVKKALVDMSFNLGLTRLNKFEKFKSALAQRDYKKAADEMLDSKWARQVKGRAITLATMVRTS